MTCFALNRHVGRRRKDQRMNEIKREKYQKLWKIHTRILNWSVITWNTYDDYDDESDQQTKKIFAFTEETISVWRRHTQINLLLTWWDPPFLCSRQMRPNRWLCRWEQLHVVSAFRDSTRGPSETRDKISISKTAQSSPSSCWSWGKER